MNDIIYLVALPLAMAFFIPMIGRKVRWLPDVLANATTLVLLILAGQTVGREGVYALGGWAAPLGIVLVLDSLSSLLLLIINLVSFMATLFSVDYLEKLYTSKLRYYSLFLLMVAGMNGTVLTGDFFNLFVFLEIASIASYALVGFGCEADELEASFKYLVIGSIASTFVLLAVALLYGRLATLNMAHVAWLLQQNGFDRVTTFAFVLLLVGFLVKGALIPFHAWLPDAHPSAPAPISAMLSGVLIKAIGIYVLIRLTYNVFGITPMLSALFTSIGVISMMIGVLLALGQWDFKRLLAYHSISQMGYVVLGIGLGTPLGLLGGLFHLLNHSLFKSLLFLDSGSVEYETGTRELEKMGNLSQKMPVTAGSTLVASLSISGIPPFNGFWSKLVIILAAVQAGRAGLAVWAVIGSILTLASFSKIQRYAFFGQGKDFEPGKWALYQEVPLLMRIPLLVLSTLCLAGGLILWGGLNGFWGPVVEVLLGGPADYIGSILGR
ncbi:MAG: NADH/ubiquinone/plastoquinone (complex I) [Candidatus Omnitrophica bacterium]|nr:NADH/ubiquinone/plastoquinone (complex I) [Candidatus Omnitrophota bacterium]MCM8768608.1 NADH/ubiquinone/plastoquinone (complex I) [Candidatus Omnitrophota bacterium]